MITKEWACYNCGRSGEVEVGEVSDDREFRSSALADHDSQLDPNRVPCSPNIHRTLDPSASASQTQPAPAAT